MNHFLLCVCSRRPRKRVCIGLGFLDWKKIQKKNNNNKKKTWKKKRKPKKKNSCLFLKLAFFGGHFHANLDRLLFCYFFFVSRNIFWVGVAPTVEHEDTRKDTRPPAVCYRNGTEIFLVFRDAPRLPFGFHWVFTGFYWVLLGLTRFYWALLSYNGFDWVWMRFTGFYWVLLGLTGHYWVWLGLTGFNWV